jgi:hypothetical protein
VDIVIKVVNDNEHFRVETSALASVSDAYNAMPPASTNDLHYAIGSCSGSAVEGMNGDFHALNMSGDNDNLRSGYVKKPVATTKLDMANLANDFRALISSRETPFIHIHERPSVVFTHECSWRDSTHLQKCLLSQALAGGTIVMRVGTPLKETADVASWFNGVCKCIRAGLVAGWSQGDVRLRNILKFDQQFQLIDYNHAIQLTEQDEETKAITYGMRTFSRGSLYDSLGPRLANCEFGQEVKWCTGDDYEMILTAVQEFSASKATLK